MVARLVRLGWLEEFDLANMPNFVANVRDVYKAQDWDAAMKYHAPWQTGMTGIGDDPTVTGEITSLKSLFTVDPRWKGKIEYLTEMRDAVGLAMLALGLDPRNADAGRAATQAVAAHAEGEGGRDRPRRQGQLVHRGPRVRRRRPGAWPGPATSSSLQAEAPNLKFVFPDEGVDVLDGQHVHPEGRGPQGHRRADDRLLLRAGARRADRGRRGVRHAGQGRAGDLRGVERRGDQGPRRRPAALPAGRRSSRSSFRSAILSEDDETYFNEQFATVIGV